MTDNAVLKLRAERLARATRPFLARGNRIRRCQRCLLPLKVCLCETLAPSSAESRFCLVMFDTEPMKPSNTGRLIADILEAGKEKLGSVERLILQPNNREDDVRNWLVQNQFKLIAEEIVEENDKIYEILVAQKGSMDLTATQLRFGPFLSIKHSPVFQKKWLKELDKLSMALEQVPHERQGDRSAISQKMDQIKEVLHVGKERH
mgnify:CR=1 FL=1